MMERKLHKYFERYCDSSVYRWAAALEGTAWEFAVVIPVRRERPSLPKLIDSLQVAAKDKRCLIILVFNSSASSTAEEINEQAESIVDLKRRFYLNSSGEDWMLLQSAHMDFFVIDRYSRELRLQEEEGVGTARKLGCDLASFLIVRKQIAFPFFLSTDADVRVPEDYFSALSNLSDRHSLGIYDYCHTPEGSQEQQEAIALYDFWLRYYRDGLKSAKSPYAHFSLGSIFAIRATAYIQARGFPQRLAGEDFYLMSKLVKLGEVLELTTSAPLQLEGRLSQRAPFGTGPGILKFMQEMHSSKHSPFYHPKTFETLGHFLEWAENGLKTIEFGTPPKLIPNQYIEIARNSKSLRGFHEAFDAFQTLKLVHALRDQHFPNLTWKEAKEVFYVRLGRSSFFSKIA